MVDVDPLVLVSVAAGVIGLLVFSFLGNSGSKKSRDEEPVRSHSRSSSSHSSHTAAPAPAPVASTPAATTTAAPAAVAAPAAATAAKKKKSKPKKAKTAAKPADNKFDTLATSSANEGEDEADDNDSVASDAIIPSKSAQALLKKSQVEAKAAAEAKAKPEEKKEPEPKKEEKKEEPKAKKPEPKKAAPAAKKEKGGKKATEAKGETKTAESAAPKAAEKTPEPEESNIDVTPAAVPYDGWAVVERKSKPKSEETAVSGADTPAPVEETKPEEPEEPAGPVVEIFTEDVVVDAKKLGLLIGPKGVTKIAIQTNSGANITMPKTEKNTTGDVTLTVSGPQEAVKKAVHAINELIAKGYATLISADDFQESYVAVHHKYLPDIIGKGGAVIRALNNHTGVKITVPSEAKTPGPDGRIPKVKIGLAGPKEKVSLTRSLIKELTRCYVTPVTHPGQTYAEVDLDKKYYNYVIGSKGSEIKHIQNSYKVAVHIPDENSVNPNIVIVGTADAVEQTKKHIDKIIERVEAAAAAREAAAAAAGIVIKKAGGENGAANGTAPEANGNGKSAVAAPPGIIQLGGGSGKPGWANGNNKNRVPVAQPSADEEEAWTREFLPPSSAIDIAAILPAGAKYSTSAPIGPAKTVATDANPTPSGLPIEPKQPASGNSAWNNIPGQW